MKAYRYQTMEKGFCEKIDQDGDCVAILIHSRWKGERLQKWLYASNFDSISQMWGEAREVMRQMLEGQDKPDTPRKIRCTSINGGVNKMTKNGIEHWVASWCEADGRVGQMAFSIRKFGPRIAKRYARQERDAAVRHWYRFNPENYR